MKIKRPLIDNDDGTFLVPLTMNKFAIIDAQDKELVEQYSWQVAASTHVPDQFYARGHVNGKPVRLHRLLTNVANTLLVDHINCNGLDNRRANLRVVTEHQNGANRRKLSTKYSSPYKGVSWDAEVELWRARISVHKKIIFLGKFEDIIYAAKAYNKAALKYFGEFARLNPV